jgi:hypothetical protein
VITKWCLSTLFFGTFLYNISYFHRLVFNVGKLVGLKYQTFISVCWLLRFSIIDHIYFASYLAISHCLNLMKEASLLHLDGWLDEFPNHYYPYLLCQLFLKTVFVAGTWMCLYSMYGIHVTLRNYWLKLNMINTLNNFDLEFHNDIW